MQNYVKCVKMVKEKSRGGFSHERYDSGKQVARSSNQGLHQLCKGSHMWAQRFWKAALQLQTGALEGRKSAPSGKTLRCV